MLLDCGNGVFSKLRCHRDYVDVDAVVISHLHADHFLDLVPYASALTYAPRQQPVPVDGWPGDPEPAPPGAARAGRREGGLLQGLRGRRHVLRPRRDRVRLPASTSPATRSTSGPLTIRFGAVPHYLPTCAVEVVRRQRGRFTYGADSAPNDELVEFAQGTDLLMLEATLPRPERNGIRGHLTPGEAGDHAARAGAGRLVLTHISDELDADWALAEAAQPSAGHVDVAAEGAVYDV